MINGFDISNVNGASIIDRALTGDFVICKATEGLTFVDKNYAGFMSRIRAAGKLTGSYHFAHWANNPVNEAAFYGAHNDRRDGEFEILDWEMYGGQANCPAGTHGPWVAEFLNARPKCGLYTNADMMGKIIASSGAAELKLIRSRVFWKATIGGTDPGNAYGFDRGVSIWQWRDSQGIDEDRAFLTPNQWRSLANGSNTPVLPEGILMALSDAQQSDLYQTVKNIEKALQYPGAGGASWFQALANQGNDERKVIDAVAAQLAAGVDIDEADVEKLQTALENAVLKVASDGLQADVTLTKPSA